jgi:Flp pilus assembly pilin Flp
MMTFIFVRLQCAMHRAMRSEEGQGLTEYALILVFIAIVAILALTFLGKGVSNALSTVAKSVA